MHPETHFLRDALILLAAAVVVVPLFQRLRLGAILGFLFTGLMIGPAVLGWVDNKQEINQLAELGVVFMLFAIGLEVRPARLWLMRRLVFGLGGLQVMVTGLVLTGIAVLFGLRTGAAVIVGFGLALSSTAFVIQLLAERAELNTVHGRSTFGVLLLQDLAVVPLLALVPLFADRATPLLDSLGFAALQTVVIMLVIVLGGRYLLRPLLGQAADAGSPEVFAAAALLVALGTAWLTEQAGLSMGMGAFAAGLLLSDSRYRYQVAADVAPFKGLLMGLFFIAVGMRLDLLLLIQQPLVVIGLLAGLLAIKALIIWGLARATGHGAVDAAKMALLLAQGGEFALVLMVTATNAGVFTLDEKRLVALLVTLSMAATPLLGWAASRIGTRHDEDRIPAPGVQLDGEQLRVIIGGFGRVGRGIAQMLSAAGVPYVAVDSNRSRVDQGKRDGFNVYFGDIARKDVQRSAGAKHARVLVLAVEQPEHAEHAVQAVKNEFPELRVVARAHDVENRDRLRSVGADHVVLEVLETTLQLGAAALTVAGLSDSDVMMLQERFRSDDYTRLVVETNDRVDGGAPPHSE